MRPAKSRPMALVFLAALLSACVGGEVDEAAGAPASPASPGPSGGEVVPFRPPASGFPRFGDVPFPSDLWLDERGQVAAVEGLERVVGKISVAQQGLASLDGFGRSTGAMFFVDAAIDGATLPRRWADAQGAESVFLVDVDETSVRRGTRYPAYARHLPSLGILSVIPATGVVLPPGVRHAAVVTSKVKTAAGKALVADETLARIASGERGTKAGKLFGEALDALVTAGAVRSREEVASLAVFTTSRRALELPALRERLRAEPAPSLLLDAASAAPYTAAIFGRLSSPSLDSWLGMPEKDEAGREWPGSDNPGGVAHDAIGAVASGAFVAPSFLDPSSRHFERDDAGSYRLADAGAKIPVTVVIPREPPPEGGYPVVIHGHGLSNDRGSIFYKANELARAGFVVVGIDDVEHGARGKKADERSNYPGSFEGPDGIPDKQEFPASFFANFQDFVAVRDNFRQTVLDQTSLVRLVQSEALDLTPLSAACGFVPRLAPSRIYWSGGSLGGIMGTMTIAIEPEIRAAALHVPGAGFVQFITTGSAKLAPLVGLVVKGAVGVAGDEPLDEFHPLAQIFGAVTEAGDPIAYAPHVLRDPLAGRSPLPLLVTYAAGDEVMPNLATQALVRALGLPLVGAERAEMPGVALVPAPVVANLSGVTGAAVAYDPANHGLADGRYDTKEFLPGFPAPGAQRFPRLPKSVRIELPIREHNAQLVTFLTTADQGSARIEITAPPRADFDADGALDADDAAPFDPSEK